MKNIRQMVIFVGMALILTTVSKTSVFGQLLINEIENDAPNATIESCQYVELRGVAGSVVPANTYFVVVDGTSGSTGNINEVLDLSGKTVGSNGTITLINDPAITGDLCRDLSATGTTVVLSDNFFNLSQPGNAESFLILRTPGAINFFEGDDIDLNNDGVFDAQYQATFIDGIAYVRETASGRSYGGAALLFIGNDVPDAATRFSNNNTPFSVAAFYYGELAASPDNTTEYAAPVSSNFPGTPGNTTDPNRGRLTPGTPNVNLQVRTPFDFDSDAKADQAVFRNGTWYILRSSSPTGAFSSVQFGLATDKIVPADYDGDGRTDVAVYRDGNWFVLRSSNNSLLSIQWGQTGDLPRPGDFDGDLKADFAVFRPSNGTWYIINSANNQVTTAQFGLNGDVPLIGDFNGDGKSDLAVFRPSDSTWYVARPTGVPAQNFDSIQFGASGDIPVPADYNGDGRTDQAVFRNGNWYLNLSPSNQFASVSFGAAGDIPVPADYNGDGRADQAVFRDGNWFANLSPGNTFFSVQFGQTGDKPIPAAYLP